MDTIYILSQVFVVLAYAFNFSTYLFRNRTLIVICNLISSCLSIVSLFFLSAWTGLGNVVIGVLRNVAFMIRDKACGKADYITKTDWCIYAGIEVATITVGILTYAGIPSIIAMFSMSANSLAITQKNPFLYKIVNIPASLTYVIYNFLITSYFGAICETVIFITIIVGIIRDSIYYKKQNVSPFDLKAINKLKKQQETIENISPKPEENVDNSL